MSADNLLMFHRHTLYVILEYKYNNIFWLFYNFFAFGGKKYRVCSGGKCNFRVNIKLKIPFYLVLHGLILIFVID